MKYVAVDIGCIECGESSAVLGIFDDKDGAQRICDDWEALGWRGGQHYYEVFPVAEMNTRLSEPFEVKE